MCKSAVALSVLVLFFIAESSCQYGRPVYGPPVTKVIVIRKVREAPSGEPLWLNQGDSSEHTGPTHPGYNGRHTRAIWYPYQNLPKPPLPYEPINPYSRPRPQLRKGREAPSGELLWLNQGDSSEHTGSTHPGYNRRHTRAIWYPYQNLPKPPRPYDPIDDPFSRPSPPPLYPSYARHVRDTQEDNDFQYE